MNKLNCLFIALVTVNVVYGQIKTNRISGYNHSAHHADTHGNNYPSVAPYVPNNNYGGYPSNVELGHYGDVQPSHAPHTPNHGGQQNPSHTNNLYPNLPNSHDTYPNYPNPAIYNQHNPQPQPNNNYNPHIPSRPVDPSVSFENRTRQAMVPGICYKEVPTATLVRDPRGYVPAGNGSNPSMSRIQVCCEGYERNVHNYYKCDPVCQNECFNGICVAPNVCRCYPDHVVNLAGFCVATCPIGCANGNCVHQTCNCKPGFTLEPHGKYCIPRCEGGCLNGNCTEPNTCSCNTGYHLSSERKCVAKCTAGCVNGDCVAPEVCNCHSGFVKDGNLCHAVCDRGCTNGRCTGPNVCSCDRGLVLDSTGSRCVAHLPPPQPQPPQPHQPHQPYQPQQPHQPNQQQAHCDSQCLNGFCSGHNQCTCNQGYVHDQQHQFRCVAHCTSGCPNGVCSGPNICICNRGFVKDRSVKGSQNCVPRV